MICRRGRQLEPDSDCRNVVGVWRRNPRGTPYEVTSGPQRYEVGSVVLIGLIFLDPAVIVPGSRQAGTGFRRLLSRAWRQQEYAIPYALVARRHLFQPALSVPQ